MKCNVGTTDRLIRIVLGLALLAAGAYFESFWGLLGIIPLATGMFRWCPLYLPFKCDTSSGDQTE